LDLGHQLNWASTYSLRKFTRTFP